MAVGTLVVYAGRGEVVEAQVDSIDLVWACQYRWHLNNGYVARSRREGGTAAGRPERIFLHKEVMGLKKSRTLVDHKDGNPLNCRRSNLRAANHTINAQNRISRPGSSSKYKGVSWSKSARKWKVFSQMGGEYKLIGYFDDEDEAGAAAAEFFNANSQYQRQPAATDLQGPGASGTSDAYSPDGPGQLRFVTDNDRTQGGSD